MPSVQVTYVEEVDSEGGGEPQHRSSITHRSPGGRTRIVHIHLVHGNRVNTLPPIRGNSINYATSAAPTAADTDDLPTSRCQGDNKEYNGR